MILCRWQKKCSRIGGEGQRLGLSVSVEFSTMTHIYENPKLFALYMRAAVFPFAVWLKKRLASCFCLSLSHCCFCLAIPAKAWKVLGISFQFPCQRSRSFICLSSTAEPFLVGKVVILYDAGGTTAPLAPLTTVAMDPSSACLNTRFGYRCQSQRCSSHSGAVFHVRIQGLFWTLATHDGRRQYTRDIASATHQ